MQKISIIGYVSTNVNPPRINESNGKYYPNFTISIPKKVKDIVSYTRFQCGNVYNTAEAAQNFLDLVKNAKKAYVRGNLTSTIEHYDDKQGKPQTTIKNTVWLDEFEVTEFLPDQVHETTEETQQPEKPKTKKAPKQTEPTSQDHDDLPF